MDDILNFIATLMPHLSPLIWPGLVLGMFLYLRTELISLVRILQSRMIHGSGIKFGGFEISEINISRNSNNNFSTGSLISTSSSGVDEYESPRAKIYTSNRDVMLVHAIRRSEKEGQLYDILVYVVPHKGAFFRNVKSVTYYFGKHFGQVTFTSTDSATNFAVTTSAYGPMLCMARIIFSDGHVSEQYRYIDFEMGDGVREVSKEIIEVRKKPK